MKAKLGLADIEKSLGKDKAYEVLITKLFSLEDKKKKVMEEISTLNTEELEIHAKISDLEKDLEKLIVFHNYLLKESGDSKNVTNYKEKLVRDYVSEMERQGVYKLTPEMIVSGVFNLTADRGLCSFVGKVMEQMEGWVPKFFKTNGKKSRVYKKFLPSTEEK